MDWGSSFLSFSTVFCACAVRQKHELVAAAQAAAQAAAHPRILLNLREILATRIRCEYFGCPADDNDLQRAAHEESPAPGYDLTIGQVMTLYQQIT